MRRRLATIIGDPYPGSRIVFFAYFRVAMICARAFRRRGSVHKWPPNTRTGNIGASDLLALLANWGPCP